jgi:membrane-bound lytic murein transglycosylase D
VRVEYPVDLATAAKSADVSVDDMKFLNPELRRWVTPLDSKNYALRVPKGTTEVFRTALATIPEAERVRFGTHVVRRGDTLSQIASRYGTTIGALTAANDISRRSLIHPGQVLTVPVPPGIGGQRIRAVQRREAVAENGQEVYVVQRGDTLGAISTSFNMSLRLLRELNGMRPRSTRIHPGQRLVVTERAAGNIRSTPSSAPVRSATDIYIVQPGDTLGHIAEAHGLGLSVLRRLNGFSSRRTRIYSGQRLRVREAAAVAEASTSGTTRYRIRRGDTLSTIARRFGVTVQEIRRWNQMSTDQIVAGERLTIYVQAGTN